MNNVGSGAGAGAGNQSDWSRALHRSQPASSASADTSAASAPSKKKTSRRRTGASSPKRRCVSTACIACRKRKSKCDGAVPSCAACASVYGTECIYDPNSDHRRKGVYKEKADSMKARNSTLQILIEAILNASEDEAFDIVRKIRTCDSLDSVAEGLLNQGPENDQMLSEGSDDEAGGDARATETGNAIDGERALARKMGELRLENGSVRFIGGTSHLIYLSDPQNGMGDEPLADECNPGADAVATWTRVTDDAPLISMLINKYFNYHYPYFTTLSRKMFERDFLKGSLEVAREQRQGATVYCSALLVNTMLALGCHFTDVPGAFAVPGDSRTKGDHFFAEAKRLITENGEYERPRLVTVQALALMSVREAGCAREAKGWVYSGMSFRMAQDIGLNLEIDNMERERMPEHEVDARRITFWGCFHIDKVWSNYLGRLPQLPKGSFNVAKFDVFPDEDAEMWSPFPDTGFDDEWAQPARTRAVALQLSELSEISSDLLIFFYHPNHIGRSSGKAVELKKLSELHRRLEEWRQKLPKELEAKEGQLPNVILMHMFFHLQYIHLFRPFLKYAPSASPLPVHVSPRRICTANAGAISKLMRLYKKTWNMRQICNIAVYMTHSACTIHLLNLPERTARRDIIHGVKHLEEIAEDWPCARRTLCILSVLARKWGCELPEDAAFVLQRTDEKYGYYSTSEVPSPHGQQGRTANTFERGSASQGGHARVNNSPSSQLPQQMLTQQTQGQPADVGLNPQVEALMQQHRQSRPQSPQAQGLPQDMGFSTPSPLASWPTGLSPVNDARYAGFAANTRTPDDQEPTAVGPMATSRPQMSPAGVSMDGHDWFLNDSARWQQSFETWNLGAGGPLPPGQPDAASGVYVFGDVTGGGVMPDGGQGQLGQRSAQHGDEVEGAFDGLGASLNGGGWLPGLD